VFYGKQNIDTNICIFEVFITSQHKKIVIFFLSN